MNENCGKRGELEMEAVEVTVEPEEVEDGSRLWLRSASGQGRVGVMTEGWRYGRLGDGMNDTRNRLQEMQVWQGSDFSDGRLL